MDLIINAANILFVLGYFTMDLLRLRLLSVAGTTCLAVYFASQPEPMLNVVAWNLFFIGLNLVQLARLLRARWRGPAEVFCHDLVAGAPREAEVAAATAVAGRPAGAPDRRPLAELRPTGGTPALSHAPLELNPC